MWSLEYSSDFSIIWPSGLDFDPTWPMFEVNQDFLEAIMLSKFHEDWTKKMRPLARHKVLYDLTYWPGLWFHLIHFQTWLRFYKDSNSWQISWSWNQKSGLKSVHKVFLWFDLVYYPIWPIFKFDKCLIEAIILSKFHEDWAINVASSVVTRFSYDLTKWPIFLPK